MPITFIDKGQNDNHFCSGLEPPVLAATGTVATPTNTTAALYDLQLSQDGGKTFSTLATGVPAANVDSYFSNLTLGLYPVKIRATFSNLQTSWILARVAKNTGPNVVWTFFADLEDTYTSPMSGLQSMKVDAGSPLPTSFPFDSISTAQLGPVPNVQITDTFGGLNGGGKALVSQRTSYYPSWNSDAEVGRDFFPGYNQLYVEFYIQFGNQATPWSMGNAARRQQKVFRIGSAKSTARGHDYFSELGVGVLWKLDEDATYGIRDTIFFGCPPTGQFANPSIPNPPHGYFNGFESTYLDYNYTSYPADLNNDGVVDNNPGIIDQSTGQPIDTSGSTTYWADSILGSGVTHKMAFFVKMNSGVGIPDGKVYQWIDDKLILANTEVPFVQNAEVILMDPLLSTDTTANVVKKGSATTLNSITTTTTSIALTATQGGNLSTPGTNGFYVATITDGTNTETIKVTQNVSDTLTVIRNSDGNGSFSFAAGATISPVLTDPSSIPFFSMYAEGVFTCTLTDGVNQETIVVDHRAGDTLTIVRGSPAYNFSPGATITLVSSTATFNSIRFGGNSYWSEFPNGAGQQTSDWVQQPYIFDQVVILTDIPAGLAITGNV